MGLRDKDLQHCVEDIFEIDAYKSKMGEDKDICVLSFSTINEQSAKDLEIFFEKGYPFVLDADSTSGEQSDGTYKVFVEIERGRNTPENIVELLSGVTNLTDQEYKFRYYKGFRSMPATIEMFSEAIPLDADSYGIKVNENNMDNYKNFFNKSYAESIEMKDDILTIKNTYADPVSFNVVDFGKVDSININEALNVNDFAEVIWLTKYIGDYNVTKYGTKIVLENNGHQLVLTRR